MSRNEYQSIGSLYSHYRYQRKTWANEFQSPWGVFRKPDLSEYLREAETIAREIRTAETPDGFQPLIEAMARLAPALLNDENRWQRFREELESVRELFDADSPTLQQYTDDDAGRQTILWQLHEFQKTIPVDTATQKSLRAVLFEFARSVAGRKNWKRPLNRWEHGVTVAQEFEFDDFVWDKPNCLRHARYQLILLGRLPESTDSDNTFNRTRIRNRATIIYEIAHLTGKDSSFSAMKKRIKESRKSGNWEAYMNKLSQRAFPKK